MQETKLNNLIFNKLTQAQYDAKKEAGEISSSEFYLITDEGYVTTSDLNTLLASKADLENGKVKNTQLDDVLIFYTTKDNFPTSNVNADQLYVDTTNKKVYYYYDGNYIAVTGSGGGSLDEDTLAEYLSNNKYITSDSLSGYAKTEDVNTSISTAKTEITNGTSTFSQINLSSDSYTVKGLIIPNGFKVTSKTSSYGETFVFPTTSDLTENKTYSIASQEWVDNKLTNINTFITNHSTEYTNLNNKVNAFLDVDDTTLDQLSELISYIGEHPTATDLAGKQDKITSSNKLDYSLIDNTPDLTGYLTISDAVNTYQPKGNYLTEHQSLADYYTKTEIDNKGYLTEHQSLANYYTKSEVDAAITAAGGSSGSTVTFREWSDD